MEKLSVASRRAAAFPNFGSVFIRTDDQICLSEPPRFSANDRQRFLDAETWQTKADGWWVSMKRTALVAISSARETSSRPPQPSVGCNSQWGRFRRPGSRCRVRHVPWLVGEHGVLAHDVRFVVRVLLGDVAAWVVGAVGVVLTAGAATTRICVMSRNPDDTRPHPGAVRSDWPVADKSLLAAQETPRRQVAVDRNRVGVGH